MSYIYFENVQKKFGENQVLKNISLEVERGQLVTLLGPSGCGKSTLLRCLAGLETVSSGKIYLDGRDITNVSPKDREIGMVFQQYSLFPNLNLEENVAFGLKLKKLPQKQIQEKVNRILKIVGLEKQKKQYPSQLSGGQQQRAALARAIVTEPKVLLLDEPLSAIDAKLRHSLQTEIRRIQRELDITAIFVTHDQEEAMVMSDVVHLMYQGEIEQSGKPAQLYLNPSTRFAASFIGHYNLFSSQQFQELCGCENRGKEIAFRPEAVQLVQTSQQTTEEEMLEACYEIEGSIAAGLPHGSILRYAVMCGPNRNIQVDVDVLFVNEMPLKTGTQVRLIIKKENVISL